MRLHTGLARSWHLLSRTLQHNRWPITGLLWAAALAMGYRGFALNAAASGQQRSALDLVYLTLQLIPLNSGSVDPPVPWQLNAARLLIPALTAYTLWQAIVTVFREQLDFVRLWRINGHVVICGLSRKGWLLSRGFLERADGVVVIEEDEQNDQVQPCRERGAIVLIGDATDPETLARAAAHRARHIIAVTNDDGVNAEIAVRSETLLRDWVARHTRSQALTCTVHLADPRVSALARALEMVMTDQTSFELEIFNVFDRGGQVLWKTYKKDILQVAGGDAPHILVIGLGRLGESLVANVSREWYARMKHIPPLSADLLGPSPTSQERLRISVIDLQAESKCQSLRLRYPRLADACDLISRQMDVHGPEFEAAEFLAAGPNGSDINAVFVCLDDDTVSLRAGLTIQRRLQQTCSRVVPVVVRVAETGGLSALLDPAQNGRRVFEGLRAFGLLEETCRPDVIQSTHEVLARAVHDYYWSSRQAAGDTPQSNQSLVLWEELDADMRCSNLAAADSIGRSLHELGYAVEPLADWEMALFQLGTAEIERLAKREHERYVDERKRSGWKVGPKDNEAKTNPTLIPWEQLPTGEKDKNRAFARALPAILARAGLQMARQAAAGVQT